MLKIKGVLNLVDVERQDSLMVSGFAVVYQISCGEDICTELV